MKRLCLGLLAAAFASTACQGADSSADLRQFLEGRWVFSERPMAEACAAPNFEDSQFQFEWRRSGGRLLFYEPPDLYAPVMVERIMAEEGGFRLELLAVRGEKLPDMHFAIEGDRRLRRLASGPDRKDIEGVRCDDADLSVTAGVPTEVLERILPLKSGISGLIEIPPTLKAEDVCTPSFADRLNDTGWLQIEVYGPVSYLILGLLKGPDRAFEFDVIERIRPDGEGRYVLDIVGKSKGTENAHRRYRLTLVLHENWIEILELSARFTAC